MARPKKDQSQGSGANGAATENPREGVGGNTLGCSEKQYFDAKQTLSSLKKQRDSVQGKIREHRKHMKEKLGINLKQFDAAQVLGGLTEAENRNDLNKLIMYAKLERIPFFSQMSLFEPPGDVSDEDRERFAYDKGSVAFKSGEPREATWEITTPMGQAWLRGYDDAGRQASGGRLAEAPAQQ